jgi:trehalose 6-phosphate phosphatase
VKRETSSRGANGEARSIELSTAPELARRVAHAARRRGARRTLLLDLDGTLAPIAPTPSEAVVPAATLQALARLIVRGWTIAVVSGRPAAQVRRLVPVRGVRVFGGHGLEGTWSGSGRRPTTPRERRRLAHLADAVSRLAADTRGVMIELKPTGVAVHDRLVPRRHRASWRRRLARWLADADLRGLDRTRGKCVVELRAAAADKGRVVRTLPRRPGAPRPDASLVGIGDDRTDEDLFRALRGRGLAVRVGRADARSVARSRLSSPAAVQRFLIELARVELP